MKGPPTQLDESVIIVRKGDQFELRYWNRVMGDNPIGPRLERSEPMPTFPVTMETRMEAEELAGRWNVWLMENKPSPKKRRKRRR